jgi:hypothetical protein
MPFLKDKNNSKRLAKKQNNFKRNLAQQVNKNTNIYLNKHGSNLSNKESDTQNVELAAFLTISSQNISLTNKLPLV